MSIVIEDNNEPLVDLRDLGKIAYSPVGERPGNLQYTKVRAGVFELMVAAQKLLPDGLNLCLCEGYRSLDDQAYYFAKRYELMQTLHPSWSHEQLYLESTKMVAPVTNLDGTPCIAPHSTGGAIDVILVDVSGQVVDMGIHPFHCLSEKDNSIAESNSKLISKKAQYFRHVMATALSRVGFVNYPLEYWHWSYGEQDWAIEVKNLKAIYGPIKE